MPDEERKKNGGNSTRHGIALTSIQFPVQHSYQLIALKMHLRMSNSTYLCFEVWFFFSINQWISVSHNKKTRLELKKANFFLFFVSSKFFFSLFCFHFSLNHPDVATLVLQRSVEGNEGRKEESSCIRFFLLSFLRFPLQLCVLLKTAGRVEESSLSIRKYF